MLKLFCIILGTLVTGIGMGEAKEKSGCISKITLKLENKSLHAKVSPICSRIAIDKYIVLGVVYRGKRVMFVYTRWYFLHQHTQSRVIASPCD